MILLTQHEERLHASALKVAKAHHSAEAQVICIIAEIDGTKSFRKLGYPSLHAYVVKYMGYTAAVAGCLISVSRKAQKVRRLNVALANQEITAATAQKMLSILNDENADELIEFSKTHSCRELERKICGISGVVLTQITVDQETRDLLARVRSLQCQSSQSSVTELEALKVCLKSYIERHDPVAKAQRAAERASLRVGKFEAMRFEKTPGPNGSGKMNARRSSKVRYASREACAGPTKIDGHRGRVENTSRRKPLTAAQKNAVQLRDGGRCTYLDAFGRRCSEDKWTAIHHIEPVQEGGTNETSNLTTLCWAHHDLIHQMSFAFFASKARPHIVRAPQREYGKRDVLNQVYFF